MSNSVKRQVIAALKQMALSETSGRMKKPDLEYTERDIDIASPKARHKPLDQVLEEAQEDVDEGMYDDNPPYRPTEDCDEFPPEEGDNGEYEEIEIVKPKKGSLKEYFRR